MIDGALTLSITLPDLRVGGRVDYGVTISGSNPVFGKGYYDVFEARYGVPLGERRVRVRYRADMPLQWRISAPGFGRNVRTLDGVTQLDIGARNIAAVQEEKTRRTMWTRMARSKCPPPAVGARWRPGRRSCIRVHSTRRRWPPGWRRA